jgi:predicted ATPase
LSASRGDIVAAEQFFRACLDGLHDTRFEILYTAFLSGLAEVLAMAGRPDEGLAAADEAVQRTERHNAFWWMPEALRIKGEVLMLSDKADGTAAEEHFRRSLDLAHRQGALSWELRAATSLARMRRDQRRRCEARELLAAVYARFSAGFETTDLSAAKLVLDEPI